MFTEKQREEFRALTEPVIEWLNKNADPHSSVIISTIHAELLLGEMAYTAQKKD